MCFFICIMECLGDTLLEVVGLGKDVAETSEAVMSALNACSRTLNSTYFCIFQWQTNFL
jgi:hypothetical protein